MGLFFLPPVGPGPLLKKKKKKNIGGFFNPGGKNLGVFWRTKKGAQPG